MRNILTLGTLALVVLLVIVNGSTISHQRFTVQRAGQSAASILMYDEYGNPQVVEEAYPGSITSNPSDVFYTYPNYYVPETYYSSNPYDSYYFYDYIPYNYTYSSPYDLGFYDYSYDSKYDYSWGKLADYYYSPPPSPPQPWYVQALPGVGNVAQTIVQGIAPQTRTTGRPTCSISANPSVVPYDGSTSLRWVSQGAEWADLTDLGTVDTSGSWEFDSLRRSKTFTLNISSPGGTAMCSTTVTVQPRR